MSDIIDLREILERELKLNRLVAAGIVERVRGDDGRTYYRFTPDGHERVDTVVREMRETRRLRWTDK